MENKITAVTESGKVVHLDKSQIERLSEQDWEELQKMERAENFKKLMASIDTMTPKEALEALKEFGLDVDSLLKKKG